MGRIIRPLVLEMAALIQRFKKLRQLFQLCCSIVIVLVALTYASPARAQITSSSSVCAHPTAGSIIQNPPEIRNPNASNPANFTIVNIAQGQNCYQVNGKFQAPTIRLSPGTTNLVLKLTNRLTSESVPVSPQNLCIGGIAPSNSTSLHYHGLNVSPQCHRDEVVKTVIKPNESFAFNIQIPKKEPPGLYWYHPHVHMQSEAQVLSGLTGAIIVEGIGKFNSRAAKLPERVFVLRDMELSKPFPDSDKAQPAKDISINSVPIRYLGEDKYDEPAIIRMKPNQEQFWRVANTASDTYLDLQVQYDGAAVPLELVAMDGAPINANNKAKNSAKSVNHILLPPAGRAEFIIKGPGASVKNASLLTLKYDTGTQGDNDPTRTIALIDTQAKPTPVVSEAFTPIAESAVNLTQVSGDRFSGLSQTPAVKERTLYFSETDPNVNPSQFYITVLGNKPKVYDPNFKTPDVTVQEGTTEDWIIQNRAQEAHAFHIHQIHFLVVESPDKSEVGMLRDTINVPAWNGDNHTPFPSVKLRMDFRGAQKDTSIAGTFVYHCHILEHEDAGMMAPIEVKPL